MSSDRIIGAVLTGGRSSRFGSDKALAPVGDSVLGAVAVAALRDAGLDPVVAVGGTVGAELGLVTVPDRWPGEGPLAALVTVLRWARDGRILVVPCDQPFLTADTIRLLIEAGNALDEATRFETAVVATVDGRPYHPIGLWPASWAGPARRLIDAGERRLRAALELGPWQGVEVGADTIRDADTPSALRAMLDERRSD